MEILMVCLGNICRSPIAEGILRQKIRDKGLEISTDSAGTSAFHAGEAPDPRMITAARKNGYHIADLRSRRFIVEDFDRFDKIFAMDRSNYQNIISLARNEDDKAKVDMMLNISYPGSFMGVPDPYHGGEEAFQYVIDLLEEAIEKLIGKLNE